VTAVDRTGTHRQRHKSWKTYIWHVFFPRSSLIAENDHCEATFATLGCMRNAHWGRGTVQAFRAQTRVPQSAGRGAYVANELAEAVGCGARPHRAHFPGGWLSSLIELCLECLLCLGIRIALWVSGFVVRVQRLREASAEEGQIHIELRGDVEDDVPQREVWDSFCFLCSRAR
jgi:hypothetical protein